MTLLRAAESADVPALLALWEVAAEKRLHSLGATRIDAMVLDGNGLGQTIWRASGFERQQEWRRWARPL